MHAHHEALGHLGRALELWDTVAEPEQVCGTNRVSLLLDASEMAVHAGDDELAVELAAQARRLVDEQAEPVRAAEVEGRLGQALWNAGRGDEALPHLAEAVRLVPERPPSRARSDALAEYGRLLMLNGAFQQAVGLLEEALVLARALGARLTEASALNTLAAVYNQLGDYERAIGAGREGLRIATELHDGSEMLRGYINGSQAIDNAGRLEEALLLGLEGVRAAHRLGLDRAAGDQLSQQAAWRLIRLGRFDEAERVVRSALDSATLTFNIAGTGAVAGYLAAVRGEFEQAEELLEHAWELMQHSGSLQLIGLALAWRVSLYLWRGDAQRARRVARDGMERVAGAESQLIYAAEFYWIAARAEAEHAERARPLGQPSEAEESERLAAAAADTLREAVGSHPGDGAPPEACAFELLARAERDRAGGVWQPHAWHAAADRFTELGQPYRAAYAELREAEALALTRAPLREISAPLRRAHAAASRLGVVPFRDEVEQLGRRTGIELGSKRSDLGHELGLTDRETEVLALLAKGRTNRQIGQELFITSKTASVHVSNILMKLGVTNRVEAAAAAHRLGLTRDA
jgi:ATP/maltotriose-dependent transcriptional regulator MalT